MRVASRTGNFDFLIIIIIIIIIVKSRRGESNFISAIRSIIDADMARQQRVHGIFKDFYVIQNRFKITFLFCAVQVMLSS